MQARNILVPIDFSETCRSALAEAEQMAQRDPEIRLQLLHVHAVVEAAMMDTSMIQPMQQVTQIRDIVEKNLISWAQNLKLPANQIQTKVVIGSPTSEIINASEHADLIVMGTHGRSGLGHFLMGSVAERVVQGAQCSVLIVKPPKKA